MVDRSTARMLVWGTMVTLVMVIVVAVYAIQSKGSLQSNLDKKLTEIEKKDRALRQKKEQARKEEKKAKKKKEEWRKERHERRNQESLHEQDLERFNDEAKDMKDLKESAKELRHRSKKDLDDHREEYHDEDEEALRKALEEESAAFEEEQQGLQLENLTGEEKEELKNQTDVAKAFNEQWRELTNLLQHAEGRDKREIEAQLERLQEFGEQNEVFLDHLAQDAAVNKGDNWKEKTRPKNMQRLMHKMDEQAEVLRVKEQVKGLVDTEEALKKIKDETKKLLKKKKEESPAAAYEQDRLKNMVESVAEKEQRLKLELLQADDMEAYQQAKALEEYSVEVQKQVADLEKLASSNASRMSPDEKREHQEALEYFEKELQEIEAHAQEIEKGFERREIRRNAVLLSKEANNLGEVKGVKELKHGKKALRDVEGILRTESSLLNNMKYHDNKHRASQRQLATQLKEEDEEFEEDARRLYGEANANEFEELDQKLEAKKYAGELEGQAKDLEHAVERFERNQDEDGIRAAAHNMDLEASKLRDKKEFQKMRPKWEKVSKDAKELEKDIGEENWDEEMKMSENSVKDINALEVAADELELEMKTEDLDPQERGNYIQAIKEMRGHAHRLKEYAKGIKADVGEKAKREADSLRKKLRGVRPFLRKEKPKYKNSMRR